MPMAVVSGCVMNKPIQLGDIVIHRVIEQEEPLFDPLTFFPDLTPAQLHEDRGWLEQLGALDPATGQIVLCIQSYVVRTPHHTILIDSCVGNDKPRPTRPFWHLKNRRHLYARPGGVGDCSGRH